jgi:hypothetical protein
VPGPSVDGENTFVKASAEDVDADHMGVMAIQFDDGRLVEDPPEFSGQHVVLLDEWVRNLDLFSLVAVEIMIYGVPGRLESDVHHW